MSAAPKPLTAEEICRIGLMAGPPNYSRCAAEQIVQICDAAAAKDAEIATGRSAAEYWQKRFEEKETKAIAIIEEMRDAEIAELDRRYRRQSIAYDDLCSRVAVSEEYAAANDAEIAELRHRAEQAEADAGRLRAALIEAREMVDTWGCLAVDMYQEKYDWEGDLAKLDAAIAAAQPKAEGDRP